MNDKRRGLGKSLSDMGLNELLSDTPVATSTAVKDAATWTLKVDELQPGRYQPRQNFDEEKLQELANSIKKQGIIQPIVVRLRPSGKYEIIAGERRWRAAQLAGLAEVPVVIRQLDDEATIAVSLIENIQRQDLNAIEESIALQRLISEFDLTHQEVADAVGKSRTQITNLLRLLSLNPIVRRMLEQNEIEMGHARALLALTDQQQIGAAEHIIKKSLSVRESERFIKQLQQPTRPTTTRSQTTNPDVARLERDLSDYLKAELNFEYNRQGKGKIIIQFNSFDELDGILNQIHKDR